jgi:hypothetical protein
MSRWFLFAFIYSCVVRVCLAVWPQRTRHREWVPQVCVCECDVVSWFCTAWATVHFDHWNFHTSQSWRDRKAKFHYATFNWIEVTAVWMWCPKSYKRLSMFQSIERHKLRNIISAVTGKDWGKRRKSLYSWWPSRDSKWEPLPCSPVSRLEFYH